VIRNDVRVVDMNLTERVKQEHDRLIVSISCQKSPDIEDFYPKWWTSVYERDRSLDVKNKYKLLVGLITDADDTAIIFARFGTICGDRGSCILIYRLLTSSTRLSTNPISNECSTSKWNWTKRTFK